jgi:inorganic pyrophosphatase
MTGLDGLPLRDKERCYNAIVETPRGSPVKLSYDKASGLFLAKRRLQLGFAFPFPFGFFPSTKAGDGDPLDVLLITDLDLSTGTLARVGLLGVIKLQQKKGGRLVRNDRVLAVPVLEHQDRPPLAMSDLPGDEVEGLVRFFAAYQEAEGVEVNPLGQGGADEAETLVSAAAT